MAQLLIRRNTNRDMKKKVNKKFRNFVFRGDFKKIREFRGTISKIYKHKIIQNLFILCFENGVRISKKNTDPSLRLEPFHMKYLNRSFELVESDEDIKEANLCELERTKGRLLQIISELEAEIQRYPTPYSLYNNE